MRKISFSWLSDTICTVSNMEVIIKRMEPCLELPSLLCIATVSRFVKVMTKFLPHLVFLVCFQSSWRQWHHVSHRTWATNLSTEGVENNGLCKSNSLVCISETVRTWIFRLFIVSLVLYGLIHIQFKAL